MKRRRSIQVLAAVLSLLALTFALPANAGAATTIVQTKQAELFRIMKAAPPDMDKQIGKIFDDMLDYDALTHGAFGTEWAGLSAAHQAEVTGLMKQLVQRQYQRNLKKTLDFTINYTGESTDGGATTVKTTATKGSDTIEINYKLAQNNGAWKVTDIETEGVSMVGSWRSQITKILREKGYDALVQKMKDKLAQP